jgi:hypothetical protein
LVLAIATIYKFDKATEFILCLLGPFSLFAVTMFSLKRILNEDAGENSSHGFGEQQSLRNEAYRGSPATNPVWLRNPGTDYGEIS